MVLGVRSALPKTAPVVVAKGYLDIAAEMTEENVEVKMFPISAIPESVACVSPPWMWSRISAGLTLR